LLPVLGRVREQAKGTQCSSNLRQIAGALHMWLNENKHGGTIATFRECRPRISTSITTGTAPLNPSGLLRPKFGFLWPYLKNTAVFECPVVAEWELSSGGCGRGEVQLRDQ
jgi:hypothetical protein